MSHYLVDKRDLRFCLFEQFDLGGLTTLPRFRDFSPEDFELVLDEAAKIATELLSPLNASGDAEGCHLENGRTRLPAGFRDAYRKYVEAGWLAPHADAEIGGQGLPMLLSVSIHEMVIGANPSFFFMPGLTEAASHVLAAFASEAQKELVLTRMMSGKWTGTMCLTEPQAGSAVGELTTTAEPIPGTDEFLIRGNKIFISAGDHDAAENIIHLVLARVPGDPAGTKGLSLFIVPRERINPDGSLGGPNDVVTSGLEHKMGIKGSPTCSLTFGGEGQCRGWLLGERRMGIVYMFRMMNEARMMCGIQGVGTANAAYQRALAYARERVQGAPVTPKAGANGQVAIVEHPDVRRNLLIMKSVSEGIRALLHQVGRYADLAENASDEATRTKYQDLLDLLTPVCKAYATDQGFFVAERAIQVHGGYGYIREYWVEQYARDLKIASIYEGTNGIQALDLLGRKLRLKGGGLVMTWMQEVNTFVQAHRDHPRLAALVAALDGAKNKLGEAIFAFPAMGKADPEQFVLQATPFLEAFGHVEVARLLVQQAVIADAALLRRLDGDLDAESRRAALEGDPEARFYDGKVQGARFFVSNVLPHAVTLLQSIRSGDRSPLDIVF